jgi:hypothetical protein
MAEQSAISAIQADCSRLFSRRTLDSSACASLRAVLQSIRAFTQSDGADAHARRADACGLIWLPTGIVVNTRRLPAVLGKGRSWINDHLSRLGYTLAGADRQMEAAVEATRILGRARYNARTCAHWTYRVVAQEVADPAVVDQADPWNAESDIDPEIWGGFESGGFL